jgi:hypothetical protein
MSQHSSQLVAFLEKLRYRDTVVWDLVLLTTIKRMGQCSSGDAGKGLVLAGEVPVPATSMLAW